jgi:predicted ATPase/class 3 adenylate cyclase
MARPTGTVTFLLTDVERSSAHWDQRASEMAEALAQHDTLVRDAVETGGGLVFSTGGDGFAAAFVTAGAAAATAVAIQEGLGASQSPLRVRMGLNTGETDERGGDYFGPTLNRAGRLRDIAHGGQVLCSDLTARLLAEGIHAVELVDLGEHRLRDLSRPERVWQLGGTTSFPPLRSMVNLPGNLPTQLTEFVGRAIELRSVREALESARIVTLTGVGGAGKTRLALQFAAEDQPRFRHGAWWCALAPLTSADAVGPLVASIAGVEPGADGDWIAAIVETMKHRQLLLVLDNCEHVLDAAATLADALVKGCPEVKVVTTSREGLGVAGERIIAVGSLALPRVGDGTEAARSADAVNLFLSRARDVRPLADDDETIAGVTHVCRRLDGIPLAIELAAARTRSLSVAEIGRLLDDRFTLLTRGTRTAFARHQTLRAAIDWSFDLLSDAEQRVLMRASVFPGGFTLGAATAVCGSGTMSAIEMLDHVDGLVRRSLLIAEEEAATTRYRMLETIRQYGAERLEAVGDTVETSRAHLDWCKAFAHEAGKQMRGRDDAVWIAHLECELDNVGAALQFAASIVDLDAVKTLLASAPIGALWDTRLGAAMAALASRVAPALREPDHPVSAALLSLLALDAALRFAGDEAVTLAERACIVARRHDDWLRTGPWLALLLSSLIANRNDIVMVAAREALARAIAEDDVFAIAEWHAELGIAHWMASDVEEAQRLTEVGLGLAEEIGADNLVMRNAFSRGASLLVPESDPAAAFPHFERAVRLGVRVGGNVFYGGATWATLLSARGTDNLTAAALARQLASHLATPMFLLDDQGMLIFYNDAAATLIGKTFEEVGRIGAAQFGTVLELATEEGEPLRRRDTAVGVAFFQRRPAHQKLRVSGYDGVRRIVEAVAVPLFGAMSELQGVVCVFWEHVQSADDGSGSEPAPSTSSSTNCTPVRTRLPSDWR